MVLKADQQRVKALLSETITLLCKNGLNFRKEFSIEGLIGITLDQDEIFLVSIKETICTAVAEAAAEHEQTKTSGVVHMNSGGVRRRRERETEVKRNASPPPLVMDVESIAVQSESQSRGRTASSTPTPTVTSASRGATPIVTTKQEQAAGDDDATDVEDTISGTAKSDLNLTFSDVPVPSDVSTDKGGIEDPPANKRRRVFSHQPASSVSGQNSISTVAVTAAAGSAASTDASSGSGFEHSRDASQTQSNNEPPAWRRTKVEQSDIIEIKDELVSDGDEGEGDGEGEEGYNNYGSYEEMYTGDQAQGGMDMYNVVEAGGMGDGSLSMPRRHSTAPQGNGGSTSRQDPTYSELTSPYPITSSNPSLQFANMGTTAVFPRSVRYSRSSFVSGLLRPNKTKLRHNCKVCGKGVRDLDNLRSHMAVKHDLAPYFTCDTCGNKFSCRNGLNRHVRTKHSSLVLDNTISFQDDSYYAL